MKEYLITSGIYFIILNAIFVIGRFTKKKKSEKKSPLIRLVMQICIALVPFLRFITCALLVINLFVPEEVLERLKEGKKE